MTVAELWLHFAVPVLIALLLARGLWALVAVELCARWLLASADQDPVPADEEGPWLVVLLPMLREQALVPETMAAFTALDYPRERTAVVVITTEREETARRRDRDRLPVLAATSHLAEAQLRGLFPRARCGDIAVQVNAAPREKRLAVLTELYDAEPTTRETVATLAEVQPAVGLRLVHLHQPDTGGRKAGQLNHAINHLDGILGPLGWHDEDDADNTFLCVYDADAVPDVRTLNSFAEAATRHRARTGRPPSLIQQQRLPLLGRRPFPSGATGLILAGEWLYQLRRSLGIELARIRLMQWLTTAQVPSPIRALLRPMIYGVGCGMTVHLPTVRDLGGFPEPMEDLGTGHRLSLLGADIAPAPIAVLDEPYTESRGLTNLHALAFLTSARPDRHTKAVAHLPSTLSPIGKVLLVLREWADEVAWLTGAPLIASAVISACWSGPLCFALALAGVLLHGPILTARLIKLVPALHATVIPTIGHIAAAPRPTRALGAKLIACSPSQPFIRLAGPWRMILRHITGHSTTFGKTER
ncbi:glycosyltransferase family protein [Streptomyces sp. DB-54]